MMGAIGTGNIRPGVVTASLGTSGTLYAFSEKPAIDPAGEVAGFCDSTGHWLPLVCTMNVTLVTELVRRNHGWDYAEMDNHVASVPPGCDGLMLLPYFSGERTPNLPGGKGVYFGIATENFTPAHTARAAVEGVTLGLGYGLTRFRELGVNPTEIRLTGGGSNSPAWRQICADVFGVPTLCLASTEGAALGAAIQAAWMVLGEPLGTLCDRWIATDPSSRAEPHPAAVAALRETMTTSHKLRDALSKAGLFA
jgi:xylulokinase